VLVLLGCVVQGRQGAHPFPCTILKLSDGIKKLRAVAALAHEMPPDRSAIGASDAADLFRGMRDMALTPEFERMGGTEVMLPHRLHPTGVCVCASYKACGTLGAYAHSCPLWLTER
jgi:hypothetical protein